MNLAPRHLLRLVLVTAVLLTSACAGIPSSGPVTKVNEDDGFGESTVRYAPAKPLPGASPEQIVRGFLDAMLAFPASSRTAAAFLTPDASETWNPATRVEIYSQPEVAGSQESANRNDPRDQPEGPVEVRLDFVGDARLDRQGRYTRRDAPASITYTLERVDEEWRIADPQDGLLVNQKFFTDYFRPFNLYYFDRPGRRLVPDPVHLVVGDQLATGLISSLGGGPSPAADGSTRTYVPGLKDLRPSVPVSDEGIADIEFTADFTEMSRSAQDHLSAQVVWTLRQVPGIEGVQIVAGSTPLTASGNEIQPIESWAGYVPRIARGRAYAVIEDAVVEIDDGAPTPVSGAWGTNARGAELIAVSDEGIAAVLPDRGEVRLSDRDGSAARRIGGNGFVAPVWDVGDTLWLVDRDSAGTRVRIVEGEDQRTIDAAELADLDVDAFALSPDRGRYAVTTPQPGGGALYVGAVLRDGEDRILGLGTPSRVLTSAQAPRSASWASGTELVFLAASESGVQVHRAAIDGSVTTGGVARGGALLPDVDADTLAVGTGESPDLYVTDARDRLWHLPPDGTWNLLESPGVTALAAGR